MRVLFIEDDFETANYVVDGLRKSGHVADHATDGQDGLLRGLSGRYEIIIVDRMLPTLDGLRIVKTLRSAGVDAPVLFLTALAEIEDRVEGLEAGLFLLEHGEVRLVSPHHMLQEGVPL